MKILVLSSLLMLATGPTANAAGITADRAEIMKQADVWSRPSWMSADGSIAPTFNIKAPPQIADTQGLLESNTVECLMTEKYATQDRGLGKTPKFNCDLLKRNARTGALEAVVNKKGKPVKLKVKYSIQNHGMPGVLADSNPEIH